jgi:hypothetical protein
MIRRVFVLLAIAEVACSSAAFDVAATDVGSGDSAVATDSAVDDTATDDTSIADTSAMADVITPEVPATLGLAVQLDGTGYGLLSNAESIYATGGFTWELWFRGDAIPTSIDIGRAQTLISVADTAQCEDIYLSFGSEHKPARELTFNVDGSGLCAERNLTPVSFRPVGGFVDGRWYHVAAVRDYPANKVALYVDGVLAKGETYARAPITRLVKTHIGRYSDGTTTGAYFKGAIDELRFYARPLPPAEIALHYNVGKGVYGLPESPGLVCGFHLDEETPGLAKDYSPNGRSISFAGGIKPVTGIVPKP